MHRAPSRRSRPRRFCVHSQQARVYVSRTSACPRLRHYWSRARDARICSFNCACTGGRKLLIKQMPAARHRIKHAVLGRYPSELGQYSRQPDPVACRVCHRADVQLDRMSVQRTLPLRMSGTCQLPEAGFQSMRLQAPWSAPCWPPSCRAWLTAQRIYPYMAATLPIQQLPGLQPERRYGAARARLATRSATSAAGRRGKPDQVDAAVRAGRRLDPSWRRSVSAASQGSTPTISRPRTAWRSTRSVIGSWWPDTGNDRVQVFDARQPLLARHARRHGGSCPARTADISSEPVRRGDGHRELTTSS